MSNEFEFEETFESVNENAAESETPIGVQLNLTPKDIAEFTRRFSGLKKDGKAKAVVSYSAYDFDAPEDDADKDSIFYTEPARIELSIDQFIGFYTLDFIYKDEKDPSLKTFWARLQNHKSNEVYMGDKKWIFYIKIVEDNKDVEKESGIVYTVDILNPIAFFLIRTIPDDYVKDYLVAPNTYCGGNTVRMLLHNDLVTFSYEESYVNEDENVEEDNAENNVQEDESEDDL